MTEAMKMERPNVLLLLATALLFLIAPGICEPAFGVDLIASYEPSEANLIATSPDAGVVLQMVEGGINYAPPATHGEYVLRVTWTGETDRKVEVKHTGLNFDLAGENILLIDVYITTHGLSPNIIGIWDDIFGWHPSVSPLPVDNEWITLEFDVSGCNETGLDHICAFVFEQMDIDNGTIYIDNIRLGYNTTPPASPEDVTATGHDSRIDLIWQPVSVPGLQGYNIYRSASAVGPFTKINTSLNKATAYSDFFGINNMTYYYYVTSVVFGGAESAASNVVSAASYAMTDDQLLNSVQEAVFRYFWDYGHPVSGMAREGYNFGHGMDIVTTGGTGMGLITICVGAERGFITRAEAAERVLKILTFLDEKAPRFHGAWSHWLNGTTGELVLFGNQDGGDIVETSFLVQGMLVARQYFDSSGPMETEIRTRVTQMWEEVEWDWYKNGEVLYWLWSPTTGFELPIRGYNECMITYLLAIASPTHPIPTSCYYNGWASQGTYENGNTFYGYAQWVSKDHGGPLFWTHYSYLGFDPDWSDWYCNYFNNSRNISLINHAWCVDNPNGFTGYSDLVWGLTASRNPWGYGAHEPNVDEDNGTIAPTAAISAMPYIPGESIATLKHFYYTYSNNLWGPFGFVDAFNLTQNWFASGYLAIDQGTIVPMIENYRTQLCWNKFMANPEIGPMLDAISNVEFANKDIGNVNVSGSLNISNGVYAVKGAGYDMWGQWDEGHIAYRRLSGDCEIIARVVSVDYTHEWAKAGVTIRESLDSNSKHATMLMTPSNRASFQWRPQTTGSTYDSTQDSLSLPYWVRLVRSGDIFTAYRSSGGVSWVQQGNAQTISMANDVYVGLVVTSHNVGTLCTAIFDEAAVISNDCPGDFDNDGDVDGSDLAVFAADFGRTDCCEPGAQRCEGNFDSDCDVDGSDLAVFAADFGRTDCRLSMRKDQLDSTDYDGLKKSSISASTNY